MVYKILQRQTFEVGISFSRWYSFVPFQFNLSAAEQRITPWEDDAAVSKCPLCAWVKLFLEICPHLVSHSLWALFLLQPEIRSLKLCFSASFHPLTNRKHHCRLCGQIICSLPIKHPIRMALCSTLFVVDVQTRQVEEVGEGVDYGVRKRKMTNISSQQARQEEEDKFLRGVRICRTCRPILLYVSTSPSFYVLFYSFISGVTSMNNKCKLYHRSWSFMRWNFHFSRHIMQINTIQWLSELYRFRIRHWRESAKIPGTYHGFEVGFSLKKTIHRWHLVATRINRRKKPLLHASVF